MVKIREASLEQLGEHLKQTRDRHRQGAASEFEVLRAEVEAANHRPLLIAARHQLEQARQDLARVLGLDFSETFDVKGELDVHPKQFDVVRGVASALSRRSEIRAVRAQEDAAEAALRAARASRMSTFSLFADLFGTSPEYFIDSDRSMAFNWIAGVTVRLPLFTGFEIQGRIRQARAEWRRAQDLRKDLEQQVDLEVRTAYRRLIEAEATLQAQTKTIQQAEEALNISQVRYSTGLGTQLEVTDAQLALARARVVRLQAAYAHAVARASLRRATGESLIPEGGQP